MPIVNPSASPAIPGVTTLASVSLFSDVRALAAGQYPLVMVLGGTVVGDGQDGVFYWSSSSLTADDGLTVLAPNAGGTGRWIRLYSGFSLSSGASHVSTVQSGTGAVSTDIQTRDQLVVYAQDYMTAAQKASVKAGGLTPTVDVTAAIVAAVAAATTSNLRTVVFPAGSYLITSTIVIPTAFTCIFSGVARTIFVFSPTAADTMFEISNSGATNFNTSMVGGFRCYSADTTYVKTAINGIDVSNFTIGDVLIDGATVSGNNRWHDSTNASVGIQFNGREMIDVSRIKNFADRPVLFAANPNTAATDCEDCDHVHLHDFYLSAFGNPNIEIASGLGASHLTIDGAQAWVGGTSGFKMNDTRVGPTVPSRNIRICNFRHESATAATDYCINIAATQAVQQLDIENGLADANIQGIKVNSCVIGTIKNVTTARSSGDALLWTGTEGLRLEGFWPQLSSSFTVSGLGRTIIDAQDASNFSGPQFATYAKTRTNSAVDTGAGFFTTSVFLPDIVGTSPARQSAIQIFVSSGVPNSACGSDGDFCFRSDGTAAGSTIFYHKQGGVWVAAVTS